jgi:hypothetical protein
VRRDLNLGHVHVFIVQRKMMMGSKARGMTIGACAAMADENQHISKTDLPVVLRRKSCPLTANSGLVSVCDSSG